MHRSKLGTLIAILVTGAGFSALAATAEAQISGSTGGNVIANHPAPAFDDPFFFPADGIVAAQWGPHDRGRGPGVARCVHSGLAQL